MGQQKGEIDLEINFSFTILVTSNILNAIIESSSLNIPDSDTSSPGPT